jgi:hypothetical protein
VKATKQKFLSALESTDMPVVFDLLGKRILEFRKLHSDYRTFVLLTNKYNLPTASLETFGEHVTAAESDVLLWIERIARS